MPKRYVSYRRVSTGKQGKSGLGLEAQAAAVENFLKQHGGKLLKDFVEVESGRLNDRPQLRAAIAFAQRSQATLIVAKLDRLSRNVAFLAALMESKVDFLATDNPYATPFTIHILAAVAQWEREAISKRTKEAMAMAKARGVKFGSSRLGHWDGLEDKRRMGAQMGGIKAAATHKKNAYAAYEDVAPTILQKRTNGSSLRAIAEDLNRENIPTRRGKSWRASTVQLVLDRYSSK